MKTTAFIRKAAALLCGLLFAFYAAESLPASAATQLSPHFAWEEFVCECGANQDISSALIDQLEELYDLLGCSKIIITSGYRCLSCNKYTDYHTYGMAADARFYDSSGAVIDSRIVCCVAADIGILGVANVNSGYQVVHIDARVDNKYWGDEIYGLRSIWNQAGADGQTHWNFYEYWGLTPEAVYQYVNLPEQPDEPEIPDESENPEIPEQPDTRPEQPAVTVKAGDSSHKTVIAWTSCANATHYDIQFYDAADQLLYKVGLDEGTQMAEGKMIFAEMSLSYIFATGNYHVNVTALNGLTGESSISEDVYFTVAEYAAAPRVPNPCDLNGDGALTASDTDMLLRQLRGQEPISAESDLNADGIVNAKDLTLLKQAVLQNTK